MNGYGTYERPESSGLDPDKYQLGSCPVHNLEARYYANYGPC